MSLQTKWGGGTGAGQTMSFLTGGYFICVTTTEHIWVSSAKLNVNRVLQSDQKLAHINGGDNTGEADPPL